MFLRIFERILFFLNTIAVFALLLAYSAPYFNPRLTVVPAFFGLAFPYIFLANLLFIIVWIMYRPWKLWFSTFFILIGIGNLASYIQIRTPNQPTNQLKTVKVLSYNVRLFDLYNWTNNLNTRNKIFDLLKKEKAEIMCFQEFFYAKKGDAFDTRDTIVDFLEVPYYHEGYTHKTRNEHYFGVVTFSKYPIVNKGEIAFDSDPNNFCIYSDIKIGKDTLRVYNTHLSSIRFQADDYELFNKFGGKKVIGVGKAQGAIVKRISDAFIRREEQTNKILDHVKKCKYPKIVCGDFNDSPMSYCYARFSGVLKDSFKESGYGVGNTYIGLFPSLRIDYIFHDEYVESRDFNILKDELSDHLALTVKLSFRDEE